MSPFFRRLKDFHIFRAEKNCCPDTFHKGIVQIQNPGNHSSNGKKEFLGTVEQISVLVFKTKLVLSKLAIMFQK